METYRDILEHHGIKGQKWGIRRYQNDDGSLTKAGERRYNIDNAKKEYEKAEANNKEMLRRYNAVGSYMPRDYYRFDKNGRQKMSYEEANDVKTKMTQDSGIERIKKRVALERAKAKNDKKAEKAEFKTYKKEMVKAQDDRERSGLNGRQMTPNMEKALYNHLSTTKGKKYADKITRRAGAIRSARALSTVAGITGASIVSAYLMAKPR